MTFLEILHIITSQLKNRMIFVRDDVTAASYFFICQNDRRYKYLRKVDEMMGTFQDLTNQISGTLKAKEYLGGCPCCARGKK